MDIKQHGGNIYKKAKELGIRPEEILDFSANINPLGLPPHVRKAMEEAIDGSINYPDPDSVDLKEKIAACSHVSPDYIVCGNGGADMLYRLAYSLKPGKVLLPVPSFTEYEEAFLAGGGRMVFYEMEKDFRIREDILDRMTDDIDLVVVCNPNNPTGLLTEKSLIHAMLDKAGRIGAKVLVDECFLEICREGDDYSIIPDLDKYPQAIVLKSFTKLYAIPGLRLGYTLCSDKELNRKIVQAGQAWPVSYIAQKAGEAACANPFYRYQVVEIVVRELAYMKSQLSRLPIELYDGQANYLFFRMPGVTDLDSRLEKYGILIRNCSNYRNLGPDYWRVAVKDHEENKYLIKALNELVNSMGMGGKNG